MAAPQRIVSLLPSATDLLFELLTDLGLAGRVVGVSHSCDHPRARRLTPGTGQRHWRRCIRCGPTCW